jgi:hypothetical protein
MTPHLRRGCIVVVEMVGRTLKSFGIMAVAFIAGGILWGTGHWLIGLILVCAAIPVALTAWIVADD